jgi:toxin HigB-1
MREDERLIETFRHKGLRQLFEDDNPKGVRSDHLRKIRQILALLDAADTIEDLNFPTFRLHPLKGELKGYWSLWVNANWRIVFTFKDGTVSNVDLVDYH